ncbi:MAG: sulfatase-like hydrolase/transferase [Verrucomicrobiota bacterium]
MNEVRQMVRKRFILVRLLPVLALVSALTSASASESKKPNIILIMADDLGAEGLGCYGSSVYTSPNLDRMATEGAMFENAYSTPLCTPTRVMIMSGQYPNRTGFTALISRSDDSARMPKALKTIGNYFQKNNYRTAIAGKWQLGKFDVFPNQPAEHGFDQYCMWKWHFQGSKASRYYSPGIWQDGESNDGGREVFGPDVYTDYLLDFIEASGEQPYFIYFPMALVHSPFIVPPALKEKASANFHDGMDKTEKNFGHMITYMDMLVGMIVDKVAETGQAENTLIVFTADNGSPKPITSRLGNLEIPGGKGSMTEAGTRVPLIAYWPGKISAGKRDALFSLADILPTLTSIAGIECEEVDGMDLSHNLLNQKGTDRDHVFVYFKKNAFVRDHRFRLNEAGKLFDIPVSSDKSRYREKQSTDPGHQSHKDRLQKILDGYLAIPPMEFVKK